MSRTLHRPLLGLSAVLAATALVLAGCSDSPDASPSASSPATSAGAGSSAGSAPAESAAQAMLARHGLAGLNPEQVVEKLDQSPDARPLAFGGSVRRGEVILMEGEQQATLPLSGDRFYLSVAPFVDSTHECFFHSLGGCQGEMVKRDIHVMITTQDGKTLVDEDTTTYTNGFVGYWLPKDITGTLKVTADGRTGEVPIATSADSPTCVTTLKLA